MERKIYIVVVRNLATKATKGALWQTVGITAHTFTNIVFIMVMGRYVSPESFGAFAILKVFIAFVMMLTEFGFGAALIQRSSYNKDHISVAFYLSLLLALFAVLTLFISSGNIASFYNDKFKTIHLNILSLLMIVKSIGVVSKSLLVRDMRFKDLTLIMIFSSFIGYILVGCTMAIMKLEIWALIISAIAVDLISTLGFFLVRPHGVGISFQKSAFKEIALFGSNLTLVRVFNQLGQKLDKLILGKFTEMGNLGFYERAGHLSALPRTYLGKAIDNVLFSSLSKVESREKVSSAYYNVMILAGLIMMTFAINVIFYAEEFLIILLGNNWIESANVFRVFAVSSFFATFTRFADTVVRSKNKMFRSSINKFVFLIVVLISIMSTLKYGYYAVALAVCSSTILLSILMISLVLNIFDGSWVGFMAKMKPIFIFCALFISKNLLLGTIMSHEHTNMFILFGSLILDGTIILLTMKFCPFIFDRGFYGFVDSVLMNMPRTKRLRSYLIPKRKE